MPQQIENSTPHYSNNINSSWNEIQCSLIPPTKDLNDVLSGSDLQFSTSVNHPLPMGIKISLIGMVLIGFPICVFGRALNILKAKIHGTES